MRENNITFNQMEKAALERLKGLAPETIAQRTDIPFDKETNAFHLTSLGIKTTIRYPEYSIEPYLPDWHHLMLLHHLEMADGTPCENQQISFRELPDGFVRGEQFDRLCERTIAATIGNYELEKLEKICLEMGATLKDSRSDLCAVFSFVPRYPLTLNLWLAEEELPGSGKIFLDRSAGHQLSTEDAVTIGDLLLEMIQTKYNEKS